MYQRDRESKSNIPKTMASDGKNAQYSFAFNISGHKSKTLFDDMIPPCGDEEKDIVSLHW